MKKFNFNKTQKNTDNKSENVSKDEPLEEFPGESSENFVENSVDEDHQNNDQDEADTQADESTPEQVLIDDVEQEQKDLQIKIDELKQEIKENELRQKAQIQNLLKKHQKELDEGYKYAATKFVKEILPIKDYLEMALKDQSGDFNNLKMGVDMTLKQLVNIFNNLNIKELETNIGDELNPNIHQAMSAEESEEKVNSIIRIQQKGYKYNERIIRPVLVVVASEKKDDKKT